MILIKHLNNKKKRVLSMKINVDPVTYDVEYVENPNYNEVDIFGYIDNERNTIIIKQSLDETRKKIVLLHEILHAMLMKCGLNLKEEDDDLFEQIIECLSHSALSLLINNPELIKYLTDKKE
jgi:Zn-dependent peptidase ImmA (M78 family)